MKDRACSAPRCCVPASANVSQSSLLPALDAPPAVRLHAAAPSDSWES